MQKAFFSKWMAGASTTEFSDIEDEILRELSTFLEQRGLGAEQISLQCSRLKGYSPPPDYEEDDSEDEPQAPVALALPNDDATLAFDPALTITQIASIDQSFRYWIALTRMGKRSKEYTRRLHIVDGCYLSRGTFQGNFELVQSLESAEFHYTCKRCFPPKSCEKHEESVSSNAESSSSDELHKN